MKLFSLLIATQGFKHLVLAPPWHPDTRPEATGHAGGRPQQRPPGSSTPQFVGPRPQTLPSGHFRFAMPPQVFVPTPAGHSPDAFTLAPRLPATLAFQ